MIKRKEQTIEEKIKDEIIDYINLLAKITPLFISKNQENKFIQQIISIVRADEQKRIREGIEKIINECPNCKNQGFTIEPRHSYGCDGSCIDCPVPQQIECDCNSCKLDNIRKLLSNGDTNKEGGNEIQNLL